MGTLQLVGLYHGINRVVAAVAGEATHQSDFRQTQPFWRLNRGYQIALGERQLFVGLQYSLQNIVEIAHMNRLL